MVAFRVRNTSFSPPSSSRLALMARSDLKLASIGVWRAVPPVPGGGEGPADADR
uniref:Uncharacterized protein n=1 Tax=Arundo donax TaxID=35708 RepID=A0A0A9ENH2_ARUDO